MKREVMCVLIFILFLFGFALISAAEEDQIEKAYTCLENRINQTGCISLNIEEKVFSYLSAGECGNELSADNQSNQCWPKSGCKLKPTAQAVLALNKRVNTTQAENWLLKQTATPTNIDWFLEIEAIGGATSCKIKYSGSTYSIIINDEKKISSNVGNSLILAQSGYWLKISPSLYNKEIEISCEKEFITTLLFMKKGSPTVHVSEIVNHAGATGTTTEKVNSLCFSQGGACNYEGSLWAALVLVSQGRSEDVASFMPYLITMKEDPLNQIYIPESFLYYITGKFREELLLKQRYSSYWEESGKKYYDTALALLPFNYEDPTEKGYAKDWLLSVQDKSGCWNQGNILDTAFLLYSIWPKEPITPPGKCDYASDCYDVECADTVCEGGQCDWDYFGCQDNDGCCPSGCTPINDNDCTQIQECLATSDCKKYEHSSDPYCSDEGDSYKDVYTYACVQGYCQEDIEAKLIKDCSDSCDDGQCIVEECNWLKWCSSGYECVDGKCLPSQCTSDNDCGWEDCKEGACTSGTCVYEYPSCSSSVDNDGCCSPGCKYSEDNDCPMDPECTSDSDCSSYNYDTGEYCFDEDVYITYYNYTCSEGYCEEKINDALIKECGESGCWSSECINSQEICETDDDCEENQYCDSGYCFDNNVFFCYSDLDCYAYQFCNDDGECENSPCTSDIDCIDSVCSSEGICVPEEESDCEENGYWCSTQANCESDGGDIMQDYSCGNLFECCSVAHMPLTCEEEFGEVCESSEYCYGGTIIEVSDAFENGETCCYGGECTEGEGPGPGSEDYCGDENEGVCRETSCDKGEEEDSSYLCYSDGEVCCFDIKGDRGKGWIIIILFLVLIVLAVVGIVFRDKLRVEWMKLKDKLGGKKQPKKFPPMPSHMNQPPQRILPRRILPPGQGTPIQQSKFPMRTVGPPITNVPQRPAQSSQVPQNQPSARPPQPSPAPKKPEEKPKNGELDEVLKKLKEMGNNK